MSMAWCSEPASATLGVVPILIGPLQALYAALPAILVALGGVLSSILLAALRPRKTLAFLWSQKLAVVVIIALVTGASLALSHLAGGAEEVSAASAGGDWPMWRGGPGRRGAVAEGADPRASGVVWRFRDDKVATFYSSPAVVGNRVYVASADVGLLRSPGAVYCIDADSGALVWKYDGDGYRASFSSPSVWGNYLVVGEGLHQTTDGRIVCLDLRQSEARREGVRLWQFRTSSHVESSPCIWDGKIAIGAGNDGLYCLALEGDGQGGPRVLWHKDGRQYPDCESSPVVHEGKIYFTLGHGGQAVVCLEAESGRELWRIDTPYPVFGSPAISGGRLLVGMGVGDYVNTAEALAGKLRDKLRRQGRSQEEIALAVGRLAPAGEVWCIDLKTHEVLWRFKTPRTVLGAVTAAGNRVWFNCCDGYVYCLSADGKLVEKWNAHSRLVTAPAVGKEHLYVVTSSGQLYALEVSLRRLVWELDLISSSISSPALARGHVYVGTSGSGLLCAGRKGDQKAAEVWAGHLGGPGRSGWTEGRLLSARGKFYWRYPQGDDAEATSSVLAPAGFVAGDCYVGLACGDRPGLAKLTLSREADVPPREAWFCPSTNPVHLSPAATGQTALFVDGREGSPSRRLHWVNARTGRLMGIAPVSPEATGRFLLAGDYCLIADRHDGLACFPVRLEAPGGAAPPGDEPLTVRPMWSRKLGPVVGVPAVSGDIAVAALGGEAPRLIAFDIPTGAVLWRRPLPAAPGCGPVIVSERIWLSDPDGGVAAFDLTGGERVGGIECGAVAGPLVSNGPRLACVNQAGQIVLMDARKAKEILRIDGAQAGQTPVLSDESVLYIGDSAIRLADFGGGNEVWMRLPAWMGRVTAPMVVVGSRVYFATDSLGLVCAGARESR